MLLKNMSDYFTKKELLLWIGSILTILISFILFKGDNTLSLIASYSVYFMELFHFHMHITAK